ncbi:threonine synthase [Enterococcus bulliens]
MTTIYTSTRGGQQHVTASQAILQGLATDGGLFVPEHFPQVNLDFEQLKEQSYQEIALLIMKAFYSDFSEAELKACIKAAYDDKFDTDVIAPVKKVGTEYYLELFHGPTLAFKDMALSILPYLMTTAAKKNQSTNELVILTATSGDTGKAAMEGFADVENTKIIVFYPKEGVSKIQEQQMRTQKGDNTFVVAVEGNFDDAQTRVKEMFNDLTLRQTLASHQKQFSSANSINIGRLIPQVVYYVYAYAQLIHQQELTNGQTLDVSVPTGNFGNILAAYYAKKLGVPIGKLICASNQNNVLTDFFTSGMYDRNREFYVTSSPSMDILISSNLERLLYEVSGQNTDTTSYLMEELTTKGSYELEVALREGLSDFLVAYATDEQTQLAIKQVFDREGYVIDPHTAVAKHALDQMTQLSDPALIVSTASPYKFPESVVRAFDEVKHVENEFGWVTALYEETKLTVPPAVKTLFESPVLHDRTIPVDEMLPCVKEILNINE